MEYLYCKGRDMKTWDEFVKQDIDLLSLRQE